MAGAALHHGLSLAAGSLPGVKGGYFGVLISYPSELAQTFWTAIVAFATCITVTVLVSSVTRPRPAEELHGLVYSLTPRPTVEGLHWYQRPAALAGVVLALTAALNLIFS
jgi:SSS family solute:Na+ symporter